MSHDNYARTAKQERDGYIWLFAAGTFALCLWGFLVYADHALSTSEREKNLGNKLRELRTAQAEVGSGVVDHRQHPELAHAAALSVDQSVDSLVSRDAAHGGHAAHGEASHDEAHHASETESGSHH